MGLFGERLSGLRRRDEVLFSPAEAFAAITISAVASDGYFSDEEISALNTTLCRMHLFRSYSSDVMRRLFDKLLSILQRQGATELLKAAIVSLPFELHETAFAVTTDLILSDGEVTEEEESLLNALYKALNIPESTAVKIIDVMMIKNKG